jgi:hypothetical protein
MTGTIQGMCLPIPIPNGTNDNGPQITLTAIAGRRISGSNAVDLDR